MTANTSVGVQKNQRMIPKTVRVCCELIPGLSTRYLVLSFSAAMQYKVAKNKISPKLVSSTCQNCRWHTTNLLG